MIVRPVRSADLSALIDLARSTGTDVVVDGVEIEHARWFTRAELTAAEESGEVLLPGWASIASRIIASWRAGTLPAPEG